MVRQNKNKTIELKKSTLFSIILDAYLCLLQLGQANQFKTVLLVIPDFLKFLQDLSSTRS